MCNKLFCAKPVKLTQETINNSSCVQQVFWVRRGFIRICPNRSE